MTMPTPTPENENTTASRTDKAVVCDALVGRLGDNEVSRIELRLPKCRCGAPAEMRTASWTWIDYVCCSKRCGATTYRNLSSGHYDGMTLDEAWEDNLAEWMRLSANIPVRQPGNITLNTNKMNDQNNASASPEQHALSVPPGSTSL